METLDRTRQFANVVAAAAQVVVPAFAPRPVGDVTERAPRTPVRPPPAAFAIWGPIFALNSAYTVYQALPARRDEPLLRRIGWLTSAAFAGNALWELLVPRRHLEAGQALVVGVASAATAAFVAVDRADRDGALRPAERWLVAVPVGALAGWTTIAAALSTADTIVRHDLAGSGRGATAAGVGLAGAAGLAGGAMIERSARPRGPLALAYGAALLWGVLGIAANRRGPSVAGRVGALAAIVPVAAAIGRPRR